jgi:cytochrome c biogenesis protein CcmG, thiol:disulfide interchange protein DsbE
MAPPPTGDPAPLHTPPPEPPEPPASAAGWRRPGWLTWSNLLFVLLLVWAAPRLWPHVAALVGVQEANRRQPQYTVTTREGHVLTPDSLRGKVVLVNFWATWCPPCRVEMPALQAIADAHPADSFVVLGLSVDRGPADAVDRFLAERGITYPVAIVGDEVVAGFGGVVGYPTSILLGRDGTVRHTVLGPIGPVTLRPAIARALAERP